jgi:hypothetical protein
MTGTPITTVSLATGTNTNVTVVDQSGNPLPDSSIAWSASGLTFGTSGSGQNLTITTDAVNGGFSFAGNSVAAGTMTATHVPSGKTASLPVTITNPVTAISFVTV